MFSYTSNRRNNILVLDAAAHISTTNSVANKLFAEKVARDALLLIENYFFIFCFLVLRDFAKRDSGFSLSEEEKPREHAEV